MAIVFACSCGKQLQVAEEFAGRRVLCPNCQGQLTVPADGPKPAAPPTPPVAIPASDRIRFSCTCGKQLQARREFAGQKTKCPDCGAALLIPGTPAPAAIVERTTAPARAGRPADFDWDDGPARPARRAPARGRRRVWPWVTAAAVLLLVGGGVAAWRIFFGGGKITDDLALVPRDAIGFASFRVADYWNSEQGKQIQAMLAMFGGADALKEKMGGLTPGDIDRVTLVVPKQNPKVPWVIISSSKPVDEQKVVATFIPGAQKTSFEGKAYYTGPGKQALHFVSPTIAVVGDPEGVQQFLRQGPAGDQGGPIADGLQLAASGKHQLVVAANLPPELMEQGKKQFQGAGGGPEAELARPFLDLRSAVLTGNFGNDLELDVRMKFADEAQAKKAQETVKALIAKGREGLAQVRNMPMGPQGAQLQPLFNQLDQSLQSIPVEQQGETVHVAVQLKGVGNSAMLVGLLVPAVQKVREAASRTQGSNNLRQLALAMITYADSNRGQLPPNRFGGGLSWRVALLPYLGHKDLYNQFHLNEPWNSPHNLNLVAKMPPVFLDPSLSFIREQGRTTYQVFVGPGAPFNGQQTVRYPTGFTDGTSNTILIAQGTFPVVWTEPSDLTFGPNQPLPQVGVPGKGASVALADGTVRSLRPDIKPEVLRALITPAGGEILKLGDW